MNNLNLIEYHTLSIAFPTLDTVLCSSRCSIANCCAFSFDL